MANAFNKNIWELDSLGILSDKPVFVHGYVFYPNQQADLAQLLWWDESSTTLNSAGVTSTITTSTDDTVTASGGTPFPNTWLDGNVVKCLSTTGSDTGKYGLIKTAGNNTVFVTHLSPFTTEASKVGHWACYPTYNALKLKQPNDTNEQGTFVLVDFEFPNLALDILSTSCSLTIYVG